MSGAATAGLEMYNLNPSFVYSFGTSLYIDRFCYGCQNHSVNWFISFLFYLIFLFFYFYSVLYVTEGRIKCGDAGRRRSHVTRCQEMRWRSSWNWCPSSTIIDHQSRNHALSFSLRFNLFQTSLLHFYFPSELPLHSLQLTA